MIDAEQIPDDKNPRTGHAWSCGCMVCDYDRSHPMCDSVVKPTLAQVSDAFQQFHSEMLQVITRHSRHDQEDAATTAQENLFDKLTEIGLAEHIDWESSE